MLWHMDLTRPEEAAVMLTSIMKRVRMTWGVLRSGLSLVCFVAVSDGEGTKDGRSRGLGSGAWYFVSAVTTKSTVPCVSSGR